MHQSISRIQVQRFVDSPRHKILALVALPLIFELLRIKQFRLIQDVRCFGLSVKWGTTGSDMIGLGIKCDVAARRTS
ncbi:MAG: hypothetical protein C5B53_04330 [Candidatus Melainabacteria bacterium]|nr:MAG: hypothetical protein C5B53_04330 [Candidatus Melainabacteria bacterium]